MEEEDDDEEEDEEEDEQEEEDLEQNYVKKSCPLENHPNSEQRQEKKCQV